MMLPSRRYLLAGGTIPLRCRYTIILRSPHSGVPAGGRAHAEIKTSARQSRNRNRRKRASEDSLAPTKASELTHEDRRGALFVSNSPTVSPMVVAPPDSTMTSTPPQKGTAPMGSVAQMHDLLQQESVAGRTSGAPAFAEVERIERRRSKPSVFDAEMHVGITERLFPEIRRLDALHELHYGDSVAREIDATVYFENRSISSNGVEPLGKTQDTSDGAAPLLSTGETDDAPLLEFSLDDDRFAAFEAESAVTTETVIAGPEGMKASQGTSALTDLSVKSVDGEAGEDVEDDVLPLVNPHGCGTPWFVPISGEVHLPALDPHDCVTLLDYLLYLRRQRRDDLPAGLRASIAAAVGESGKDPEPSPSSKGKKPAQPLQWAQVMSYLATAPAAVLGFTESLHPRGAYRSSGWVFVLYTENVSLQNAIGHLAALFELPQKVFHTRTNASKMSCAAQLCVLEPNCLGKEHLLLLNTMRHPGFVLRVGMIREVPEDKKMEEVVGDLARWQPLYRTEMLLRRVSGSSIKEIEHRLKCVRDVGSIFFCANREASLARAATDLFHGYYKSALLNALHRPKPPLAMRHFLLRPNVITASRARRAVTDSTIRQVLKVFLQTNGNWKTTVQRVPYPWRRRWLSALRSSVWNAMASKRIKEGGREVLIGDVVLRPEYRSDANHRLLSSVKEEHLKLVETAEEARMVTLEDVFIPFLRGIHPTNLFAPESSSHPIQTRSSMTAMLQSMHAMDLLTGLSPEMRDLLDVRSSKSPMVFRRLLMRPLHLEYDILEDKGPWKSTHFDAARILRNDRWEHAASASTSSTPCGTSSLVAQSEVLERTSIGAQLSRGVLAEEFFRLPSREDYAVLGQSKRNLHGNLSPSEPLTPDGEMGERLYTVHLRAVVRNSVAGLNQILREYFVLGGIEQESDSALQHKVHRVRRELDPETSLLTAPSYCTACYCHDHDNVDACAEYRFKQGRINGARLREESLYASLDVTAENQASGEGVDTSTPALADGSAEVAVQPSELRLQLTLALRRANAESKWGVHLTNRLHLTGLESLDVLDVRGSSVSIQAPSCDEELAPVMTQMNALRSHVEMLCTTNQTDPSLPVNPLDSLSSLLATLWDNKADEARARLQGAVQILNNGGEKALLEFHSPSSWSSLVEKGNTPWRRCKWTLSAVNTERVQDKKGVAAAFVRLSKERQVKLLFEMVLHEDLPKPASLSNDNSNLVSSVPSTPALDFVPYHANRKLAKAHAELIAQCSADARKWLRELPTNLTMVLTKAVTHYTPSTSWGIQVCATDMTLTNFSIMLSEYRKTVSPTSEIATVYSISPESCFPRTGTNTWMTDAVIGELPRMMEVLNHLYNVRSINGRRVFTKDDAVQAIRRFEDQVGQSGLQENEQGRINLPITLQLSPETYGLLQRATADGVAASSLPAPAAGTQPTNCTQEAAASGKEDSTSHPAVFAPDQQKLLTEAQQLSQVVTIAINRRIVNERTAGKWGVQVEARTRRLKHLQHNHSFSMQVFASKRSQVVRISDALKHVSEEKRDKASAEGENAGTFFSNYVYCIEAVNSDSISDYTELKSALNRAALPTSAGGSSIHGEASTVTPESVTLRVRQYALARLAVVVRRGGPGEVSALSPVGLNVNQHLCVRAITPDSPMAKSVELATAAHCSLRCFLRDEPKDEDGRRVTVDCLPRNVLDAFIDCFPSMEDRLQTNAKAGSRKARPGTSKWKYQLDEDAMGGDAEASVSSMEEQHSHFERQASDFIGDCGIHSMIDAVPFLQVMYMLEFYHRFHSVSHPGGGSKVTPTREDEDELAQKLARVHRQVQWRVTYASRSGITLRSPSDLAKVFAPGVAEETVYIQQCVDE